MAEDWAPLLSFRGSSLAEFEDWQAKASEKFFELLGDFPAPVDPEPEVIYSVEEGGIIRERVIFGLRGAHVGAVRRPAADGTWPLTGRTRRSCAATGTGRTARSRWRATRPARGCERPLTGTATTYGEIMARAGYLTLSPDLRVFGERDDGGNPYPGRDKCNVHFLRGAMWGVYTLMLNIWDMKCCVDYLQSRAEVDAERIGMMGLSQGGTMTTFATAAEPRIKCAGHHRLPQPVEGVRHQPRQLVWLADGAGHLQVLRRTRHRGSDRPSPAADRDGGA